MCGPPRDLKLLEGGYQTWKDVLINLLEPHKRVVASGIGAMATWSLPVNTARNCRALFRAAYNFLQVAAQVGYTSGLGSKSRKHVRWCRERRRAARSSQKSETRGVMNSMVLTSGRSQGLSQNSASKQTQWVVSTESRLYDKLVPQ